MTQVDEDMVGFVREVLGPLLPRLDEKSRRLAAGALARALGHGGIAAVARVSGLSLDTVRDGVRDLEPGAVSDDRVRRPGGGRKPAAENDPHLVPALLKLVEPTRRGDPMGPSCWTTLSTRDLAGQLTGSGHPVSYRTVRLLLREQGFVLRGNAKVLEGARHADRDAQFRYINDTAEAFLAAGDPVVSIDAKKKEMIGPFSNPGRTWQPADAPVKVRDHTFINQAQAVAVPFGVYDIGANSGWVNVGIDHNTAAFAVESIRRWWNDTGRHQYPDAGRLLVCADAGRPNAADSWTFKAELAELAAATGLEVTVAHYPPGTSKWNKIEHRLFSAISMNWRGMPLTSLRVVVEAIAATTNASGLTVRAELDEGAYPLGRQITRAQREALPLHRHTWHGDWNYTLRHIQGWTLPPASGPHPRAARPDTSWLHQPAITGMPRQHWADLVAALQADTPRHGAPPVLGPAERLLATILNLRHTWTQAQIAHLMRTTRETVNHSIQATTAWLEATNRDLPHPTTLPTATAIATALQQTSTT